MAVSLRVAQFIEHYIKHKNATRAAIHAGYAEKSAAVQGCRLLRKANVLAEINRLKQLAADNAVMSMTEAQQILTEIARGKLQDYIREDGSIDLDAIKAGGRDIQEIDLSKGKIKLRSPETAIKELGDISNWDKAPAQKINFIFNLGDEEKPKPKQQGEQ